MKDSKVSLDEQETILNIVPAQISNRISVYTSNPVDVRYYRKLADTHPDEVTVLKSDGYGMEVELPVSWFRRPKPPNKRQMTDEQRAATAARLQLARQKKQEGGGSDE